MPKLNASDIRQTAWLLLHTLVTSRRIGTKRYRIPGLVRNRFPFQNTHEPWLDKVVSAALACTNGTFVDVGANIGQTLVKILALGSNVAYVGFEPQIDCCAGIAHFIKSNGLPNCSVFPVGLSNTTGTQKLYKHLRNADVTASVVHGFRPDSFYSAVEVVFLVAGDDLFPALAHGGVGVIKIDVEGGELEVLQGLMRTLRDYSPIIIFEVLNHFLLMTNETIDESTISFREARIRQLEELLRSVNYLIYQILPGKSPVEVKK